MTPDQCIVHTSDGREIPAGTFHSFLRRGEEVARIMSVYVNEAHLCARIIAVTDDTGTHRAILSCNDTDFAYVEVRYR